MGEMQSEWYDGLNLAWDHQRCLEEALMDWVAPESTVVAVVDPRRKGNQTLRCSWLARGPELNIPNCADFD